MHIDMLRDVIAAPAILVVASAAVMAQTPRMATLEDAYAVKITGALAANPVTSLLAIESGGSVIVMDLDKNGAVVDKITGANPSWSPDGTRLAYIAPSGDENQLFTWDVRTRATARITDIPGGIAAGKHTVSPFCRRTTLSWSRDSEKLALSSRILSARVPAGRTPQETIRVFDGSEPVEWNLLEGVFAARSFPATRGMGDVAAAREEAAGKDPESGLSRIVIADVRNRSWSDLPAENHLFCPSWSPDGRYIASIAALGGDYPVRYFGGSSHVQRSGLSLYDTRTRHSRSIALPANRIGPPAWSPDSSEIVMVVERNPPIYSFTRLLSYSPARDVALFLPGPGEAGVKSVKWTRDGGALWVTAETPFVDTLWRLDPRTSRVVETDTGRQIDGFDELAGGAVALNIQGPSFRGRVMILAGGKSGRTVFDPNPQLAQLRLGEQKRITWTNRAGEAVDGIVILPPGYVPGRRYPLIVNPYPGVARDILWLTPAYEATGQIQAAWGYVIFRPLLRAPHTAYSFTRGEQYTERARGVAGIPVMLDDFESGIEYLDRQGWIDRGRIGLFGHSNGGWVTNMLVTRSDIPRAAIVTSGFSNAIVGAFFPAAMSTRGADPATGGNVFDNFEDYVALSPVFRMRELKIPMLLTIGDDDWAYLPQIIGQYGVLRHENKDVRLVRYAGEGHSLRRRENIEDALDRMRRFYDRHLSAR